MENEFFTTLSHELAALFNDLLAEPFAGMFRRQPEVVVGGTTGGDANYHLYLVSKEITQSDRGTFSCSMDQDTYLVFRSPSVIQIKFMLCAQGLAPKQSLRAQDRLMTFFFDNKLMEPIVPEYLNQYAAVSERLKSRHAELKVRDEISLFPHQILARESLNEFRFAFDYCALYHSGNFVRQENRTKARAIEFANEANERSS